MKRYVKIPTDSFARFYRGFNFGSQIAAQKAKIFEDFLKAREAKEDKLKQFQLLLENLKLKQAAQRLEEQKAAAEAAYKQTAIEEQLKRTAAQKAYYDWLRQQQLMQDEITKTKSYINTIQKNILKPKDRKEIDEDLSYSVSGAPPRIKRFLTELYSAYKKGDESKLKELLTVYENDVLPAARNLRASFLRTRLFGETYVKNPNPEYFDEDELNDKDIAVIQDFVNKLIMLMQDDSLRAQLGLYGNVKQNPEQEQ